MSTVRRSRLARVGRNPTVGRSLIFLFSSLILVHKDQPPLGSSTIELLYIVSKHGAYSQNSTCSIMLALPGAPYPAFLGHPITCLSRKHTLPKNTTLLTIGRGCPRRNRPGMNKLHCMSTNRLNRVDSKLIPYMKVDSGLIPGGKTSLNKYPKTGFRW